MGVRITTGRGAKAVSNLLMEAVAGRNMSMTTDRLMPGNANHRATVRNRGRDKGRSGRASQMEYLVITSRKKKENQNNTEEIFGPTLATVESSR